MRIWLGTSGYSYPTWVGSFYPPGTAPRQMLTYYCQQFPLVELNFSYYRVPTPAHLARLTQQTPDGFQFLIKLHQSISHEQRDDELPAFRTAVEQVRRGGKLMGLLCQFPQALHHTAAARRWVETLAGQLAGYRLAVEFRHRSWHLPEVTAWLAEQNIDLVSVDVPDLPGLYPRGLVRSTSRVYVRLHSRAVDRWYRDESRYDYDYRDEELAEWIAALTAEPATEGLLLFNNCQRTQAARNARRMRELLTRLAPRLEVVPPPETKTPMLFE
jgi:uncharacterized protein YecE (DUF72 family)